MSTRSSLKYEADDITGQTVHLYEDLFDDDHVYLVERLSPSQG